MAHSAKVQMVQALVEFAMDPAVRPFQLDNWPNLKKSFTLTSTLPGREGWKLHRPWVWTRLKLKFGSKIDGKSKSDHKFEESLFRTENHRIDESVPFRLQSPDHRSSFLVS